MRERGVTVVELLVSLSIASILLALVYQVFISQRRTYTAQEEVAEMQQNARSGSPSIRRKGPLTDRHRRTNRARPIRCPRE